MDMGLFKNIFGSSEPVEEKVLPWQPLTELQQLEEIEAQSHKKTQIIFKHSTTCGISKMAMKQFVGSYDIDANLDLYYLDLLNYREVSNETGYKFQVIHQSPQLLIIKNGVVVAHASHGSISDLDLLKFA
jgi:bacillithiol system protein YtxJ